MYTVDVSIEGTAPLLQHRYPLPELSTLSTGGTRRTGAVDYTEEWREYFYADSSGQIYQPNTHLEASLTKAAAGFKITGKRGKTYSDLFKAAVFVHPERIPHMGVFVPETLDTDADKPLYLDVRPVVVNRARVVRIRPAFRAGWRLAFEIEVIDDQISSAILSEILTQAGRTVGIGDHRPRFGRFLVTKFEVHK